MRELRVRNIDLTAKNGALIHEVVGFGADLRRYLRIMIALFRQEEELRRHAPFEAILELIEPVLVVGALIMFRTLFEKSNGGALSFASPLGGDMILFYVSGFFPKYLFLYISFKRIGYAISPRQRRFPIEQPLDAMFVHIVLRYLEFAILGVLIFGGMYLYGIKEAIPYDYEPIIEGLLGSTALAFGWGLINGAIAKYVWFWHYVSLVFNRALIMMSGCLFLPDFLAPDVRYILSFNPEVHAIALFRTAFYPHYPTVVLDTTYLIYTSIGAIFLGLVVERISRRAQ